MSVYKFFREVFMTIFLIVLGTVFVAEMGDKTQLLLVAMAGKYRISQILTGTWLATLLLNFLAVFVGAALSRYLDMRIVRVIAAAAFFWFACSMLKENGSEEDDAPSRSRFGPVLAIFGSFFIGELGDKTQLSAVTLAASYTQHSAANAVAVFAGCTIGLILADLIGLLAGLFLKNKMPTGLLNKISFIIFAAFGVSNTRSAADLIFPSPFSARAATICVFLLFCLLCAFFFLRGKDRQKRRNMR